MELVILLLGGVFFASLSAIVLRGSLREGHPWRRFADEHGWSYRDDGGTFQIEGIHRGRAVRALGRAQETGESGEEMSVGIALEVDELPRLDVRRRAGADEGGDASRVLEVAGSGDASPLELEVDGDGDVREFLEASEAGNRLLELQRAEPRLQYVEGRLVYRAADMTTDRRRLGELFDRMVESARYIEGEL